MSTIGIMYEKVCQRLLHLSVRPVPNYSGRTLERPQSGAERQKNQETAVPQFFCSFSMNTAEKTRKLQFRSFSAFVQKVRKTRKLQFRSFSAVSSKTAEKLGNCSSAFVVRFFQQNCRNTRKLQFRSFSAFFARKLQKNSGRTLERPRSGAER